VRFTETYSIDKNERYYFFSLYFYYKTTLA